MTTEKQELDNEEEILNDELNELYDEKNQNFLTTYTCKNENSNESLYELTRKNVINVEIMLLYNPRYPSF